MLPEEKMHPENMSEEENEIFVPMDQEYHSEISSFSTHVNEEEENSEVGKVEEYHSELERGTRRTEEGSNVPDYFGWDHDDADL